MNERIMKAIEWYQNIFKFFENKNHGRISRRCPIGLFRIFISVVTRFVMMPINDFPSLLSSGGASFVFSTAVVVEVDAILSLLGSDGEASSVLSVVSLSAWAVASLTGRESGVESGGSEGFLSSDVKALMRMRIECSKTSCVRMASTRTLMRVC